MIENLTKDQTLSQLNCVVREFGLYSCGQNLNIVNGWPLFEKITLKWIWTSEIKVETVQGGACLSFWFWRYPGGLGVDRWTKQFRCARCSYCSGQAEVKGGKRAGFLRRSAWYCSAPTGFSVSLWSSVHWYKLVQEACNRLALWNLKPSDPTPALSIYCSGEEELGRSLWALNATAKSRRRCSPLTVSSAPGGGDVWSL